MWACYVNFFCFLFLASTKMILLALQYILGYNVKPFSPGRQCKSLWSCLRNDIRLKTKKNVCQIKYADLPAVVPSKLSE